MRKSLPIPAVLAALAAAALLGACKAGDTAGNTSAAAAAVTSKQSDGKSAAPAGTTEYAADGIRRVGVAELQKMVESGDVVIYDTRAKAAYDEEHIKGALSLPQGEAEKRAGEVPRDKTLVFYCTWPAEQSSAGAARILKTKGIEDTAALVGGMAAWKNAGLPTEGTEVK